MFTPLVSAWTGSVEVGRALFELGELLHRFERALRGGIRVAVWCALPPASWCGVRQGQETRRHRSWALICAGVRAERLSHVVLGLSLTRTPPCSGLPRDIATADFSA